MKRCPKCNQVYTDDNLNFCLADGMPLSAIYDSEQTLVLSSQSFTTPSTINSPSKPEQRPSRQGVSPFFAYALVGLLVLLIVGGIVMWLKSDTKTSSSLTNQNPIHSTVNSASQNSSDVKEESNANRNQRTSKEAQTENSVALPPLTVESVQSLMNRWENAQDTQNFAAYESCYGYSFRGVLRTTSGRVKVYGFNDWMKDRRRMINQVGGLEIDIRNMSVNIDGDTATVEFDQYYRSGSYSDWGPKVIKVKASPDGEKIVYEELKASYSL